MLIYIGMCLILLYLVIHGDNSAQQAPLPSFQEVTKAEVG